MTMITTPSTERDISAAQKRVMRAWTKLESRRDRLIAHLQDVDKEMNAMNPLVELMFNRRAA